MDTKNKDIQTTGIIIKVSSIREYDKNLIILTKDFGKISVSSFGSKRVHSKNISKTDLFVLAKFDLKLVKDKYNLNYVNVIDDFKELSADYKNLCYGSYFLELLNYFSFENNEFDMHLSLIYYSLKSLINNKINKNLIRRIFELKCLQYEGIYRESNLLPINSSKTLKYSWEYILNNEGKKLFSFNLADKYLQELEYNLDVDFHEKVFYNSKTLKLINSI